VASLNSFKNMTVSMLLLPAPTPHFQAIVLVFGPFKLSALPAGLLHTHTRTTCTDPTQPTPTQPPRHLHPLSPLPLVSLDKDGRPNRSVVGSAWLGPQWLSG
jgi:hypothetical protein